ncbi:MAG: amino acid ABC transporter substrate-binding protein [Holophagales bacterium]|nr:amino acid ABC transporter substrate-binding protein [Holophagales bacterium]MYJ25326.1 amino acid ABC transporter substrate-binding protein [Holophagales bacterium]
MARHALEGAPLRCPEVAGRWRPEVMNFRTRTLVLLGALCLLLTAGCGPEVPTVNFSVILPMTGPAGIYGEEIANGIQLRQDRLMSGDEPLAYNVVVEVIDSEGDAQQAASLLETAFSTSLAAIGGATSAEALAMVPVAEDADRVLVSPSASSPELSGASEYFYRLFPSAEIEASTMATFLRDRVNVQRLALVVEDSAFGTSLADSVETVWGTELAGRVTFTPSSDQNAMVQEALGYEADGIYVAASGAALAEAIQALRLAGFDEGDEKRLATSSSLMIEAVLKAAGPAANGVFFTAPVFDVDGPDEPTASFVADYRERFTDPAAWTAYQEAVAEDERARTALEGMDLGNPGLAAARTDAEAAVEALTAAEAALNTPSYYAGLGYDSMGVLIGALAELEVINVPSDFLKGMRAIRELPGVTGTIQFRETGDVQKFTRIYQVVDGKPVDFEKHVEERLRKLREEMARVTQQIERANRNQ